MPHKNTSWGGVAGWYHEHLEKEGTYQKEVILPHLLRIIEPKKGMKILDLACGSGFFSREFAKKGAEVIGVDVAKHLIALAEQADSKNITYHVSSAHKLSFIPDGSIDVIVVVLAIQNIEDISAVFAECARVLKPKGSIHLVMNHPVFRAPKRTSWGWDEETKEQYRRIDSYMSESTVKIQMHPGDNPDAITISFHRPLQVYAKQLRKHGLAIRSIEEWISHKKSEPGARADAENKIRKEIPLFMYIEVVKVL
jgi:ubiquinone/menaquinone biosynthesis C-methylase UbiE